MVRWPDGVIPETAVRDMPFDEGPAETIQPPTQEAASTRRPWGCVRNRDGPPVRRATSGCSRSWSPEASSAPSRHDVPAVQQTILGRDTNVRLSLCLVQRLYLALSFSRAALSSTHSSLKPQEAHRYLVTRTALKLLQPTGMLLPAP